MKTSEIVSALESIARLAEKVETSCWRGAVSVPTISDMRGEIDDLLYAIHLAQLDTPCH